MAFSKITVTGEDFIRHTCIVGMTPDRNGNTLLVGKNKYPLPYCAQPTASKIWTCNITLPNSTLPVVTANDLANFLIYWFNFINKT